MKLIVISNNTNLKDEFDIVNKLFENGLEIFHLRKSNFTEAQIRDYLTQIDSKYLNRIVLHSHFYLVKDLGLKGIHIKPNQLITNNYPLITKSASCHSYEEVELAEKTELNYVFLSPIFDSISKLCYDSDYEQNELISFLKKDRKVKIIALSGVDETKIKECKTLGFDGAAVLGAIWKSDNPIETFNRIKNGI